MNTMYWLPTALITAGLIMLALAATRHMIMASERTVHVWCGIGGAMLIALLFAAARVG